MKDESAYNCKDNYEKLKMDLDVESDHCFSDTFSFVS